MPKKEKEKVETAKRFKQAFNYRPVIKALDNNTYLMTIGCVNLSYLNTSAGRRDLVNNLLEYLENPKGMEEQYYKDVGDTCDAQDTCVEVAGPSTSRG